MTYSAKELEALLALPALDVPAPKVQITHADKAHPLFQKLTGDAPADPYVRHKLSLRAEEIRQKSRLNILLYEGSTQLPASFSYIHEAIRKGIRNLHGLLLWAHEPGLGSELGLQLLVQEHLLRGLVHRVLVVAPGEQLSFWQAQLFHPEHDFQIATSLPEGPPPARLLLDASCLQEALPDAFVEQAKYQLVVVIEAEGLRKRRSRPWKNLLALSPARMFLRVSMPFEEKPAELHGLLALLGVPELPPAARLKRELDGEGPIQPDTRQVLRPFLQASTLRNTHPTTPVEWPERVWKAVEAGPFAPFRKVQKQVAAWLSKQLADWPKEEAEEESPLPPKAFDKQWAPLFAASSPQGLIATLEAYLQDDTCQEHHKTFQGWKAETDKIRSNDPRLNAMIELSKEYPNYRILVWCQDKATATWLAKSLPKNKRAVWSNQGKRPDKNKTEDQEANSSAMFVAADEDVPTWLEGPFDLVFHFDSPWSLSLLDLRSHWLLHQQEERTRQIVSFFHESSAEGQLHEQLTFRFKPETLGPGELSTIAHYVEDEWQLPMARWRLLTLTSAAFGEACSKPFLEARKRYRQLLDLNQRLFLDDYAL